MIEPTLTERIADNLRWFVTEREHINGCPCNACETLAAYDAAKAAGTLPEQQLAALAKVCYGRADAVLTPDDMKAILTERSDAQARCCALSEQLAAAHAEVERLREALNQSESHRRYLRDAITNAHGCVSASAMRTCLEIVMDDCDFTELPATSGD